MSDWDKIKEWIKEVAKDVEGFFTGDVFKAKVKELRLMWQKEANEIINTAEEELVAVMVADAKLLLPAIPSSEVEKFVRKHYWATWNKVEAAFDIEWIEDTPT